MKIIELKNVFLLQLNSIIFKQTLKKSIWRVSAHKNEIFSGL